MVRLLHRHSTVHITVTVKQPLWRTQHTCGGTIARQSAHWTLGAAEHIQQLYVRASVAALATS